MINQDTHIANLEAIIERQRADIAALTSAPSLFERVMTVSPQYVTRFKGRQTLEGVLLAYEREAAEFVEAMESCVYGENTDERRKALAGEAMDVMVTMGGILHYLGVSLEDINQAARGTLTKLDNRTDETHAWHEESKTVIHRNKMGETK